MVHLIQVGRFIKIEDISLDKIREIKKLCSYTRKGAIFMPNPEWAVVRLYNEKTGMFPIGLLGRVQQVINAPISGFQTLSDSITGLDKIIDLNENLRSYQKDTLKIMINNNLGIIKMPTGSGKTRVAVEFIKLANVSTLIVVPTIDIKKQWKEQVSPLVHVMTYQSIKKKEYLKQFDLVIFDESHHLPAKSLYKIGINLKDSARVYGFSATPMDREDDNLKIEAVLGPIIYDISTTQLTQEGYLCPAEIIFHEVPEYKNPEFNYQEMYDYYIINNLERNNMICNIAKECIGKTLILVSRIEHGETILDMLKDYDVVFINGQLKKIEREDVNHKYIIATTIYDEGIDISDIRNIIICSSGKSAIKTIQRVGRGLRKIVGKDKVIVHDFLDNCRWLYSHSHKRIKILSKDFTVLLH